MADDLRESDFENLRYWVPHVLWIGILFFVIYLVGSIFAPLGEAILIAISITTLTYPILYTPINRLIERHLSSIDTNTQRLISGAIATVLLLLISAAPFAILLANTVGPIKNFGQFATGILTKDPIQQDLLLEHVDKIVDDFQKIAPNIPINKAEILQFVADFLRDAGTFAKSYMSFLFKGTGGFAVQLVLAVISIFILYAEGPILIAFILRLSPLSSNQSKIFLNNHRLIVLRLLTDTVATAFARGIILGVLGWMFTSFNFFLIAFVATLISLIPLVGNAMLWLPFASFIWSDERQFQAILFATLCVATNILTGMMRKRLSQSLYEQKPWLGFLIFMSIVGGVLSFGFKGFLIGPSLVIITVVIGTSFLDLYGTGQLEENSQAS